MHLLVFVSRTLVRASRLPTISPDARGPSFYRLRLAPRCHALFSLCPCIASEERGLTGIFCRQSKSPLSRFLSRTLGVIPLRPSKVRSRTEYCNRTKASCIASKLNKKTKSFASMGIPSSIRNSRYDYLPPYIRLTDVRPPPPMKHTSWERTSKARPPRG